VTLLLPKREVSTLADCLPKETWETRWTQAGSTSHSRDAPASARPNPTLTQQPSDDAKASAISQTSPPGFPSPLSAGLPWSRCMRRLFFCA